MVYKFTRTNLVISANPSDLNLRTQQDNSIKYG